MIRSILIICLLSFSLKGFCAIDKPQYFAVFGSSSVEKIRSERTKLEKLPETSETRAYLGALLMKEAQYLPTAKEKLARFKQGKALLEKEIAGHASNVEYRLLRLMIQENCPSLLHYSGQLKDDAALIAKGYEKQPAALKTVIRNYAESSAALPASKLAS